MRKYLLGAFILFTLVSLAIPRPFGGRVRAQEGTGLTEEENALLDRIEAGFALRGTYTTDWVDTTETFSQTYNLAIGGQTLGLGRNYTREDSRVSVFATATAPAAIQARINLDFSDISPAGTTHYILTAQTRQMDNTLFVNAEYEEADAGAPEVFAGWQAFTSAEEIPSNLETLDLASYFEERPHPLADRATIEANVESITLVPFTLEDGTELEVITLTFTEEGFQNVYSAFIPPESETSENPFEEILGEVPTTGTIIYSVGLDAEGNVITEEMNLQLNIIGLNLEDVSEDFPPGTTLDLNFTLHRTSLRQYINTTFPPILPPEMG